MDWLFYIVLSFAIGFTLAIFIIPNILLISFKRRLFDQPNERKVHKGIVPRLGGISFFPSILFSVAFVMALHNMLARDCYFFDGVQISTLLLVCCSMIVMYLIGIADDLVGIRYRAKFAAQIACAIMMVGSGLWFNDLYGLFGIEFLPWYVGMPLTAFIIVFIINAINLIDGIDGLASGLSGIAFMVLGVCFIFQRDWIYAVIAFAALGVLVPFFYYNVFGKVERGRKIFMGDCGSLTTGLLLAALSIRFSMFDPDPTHNIDGAIIIAFSLLIVPIFDVIRVVIHRVRLGNHPFKPDKNHIHHKFLELGLTHRRCMISILMISLMFSIANVLLLRFININLILVFDIVVWTLMNMVLSRMIRQKKGAVQPAES